MSVESEMRYMCTCVHVCAHACALGRGWEKRHEQDSGRYLSVSPDMKSLEEEGDSVSSQLQVGGYNRKGDEMSVLYEAWPTALQRNSPRC